MAASVIRNPHRGGVRFGAAIALLCAILLSMATGPADAGAKRCFGKKVNRVIKGNGGKVRLKFRDVAFVSGKNVTVIGKAYSVICGGSGRQIIRAGKGRTLSDGGRGNDKVLLHDKSFRSKGFGGLGNDVVQGSRNHDFLYGGPRKVPKRASDNDTIRGLGGNDRMFDYAGKNNLIGGRGSDRIFSVRRAISDIYGGNGTDFLTCNGGETRGGRLERVFGERGNDRIRCGRKNNNGGAFIDGGEGDDHLYGTPSDDVVITHAGTKTIDANAGDDLVVTTSKGQQKIAGGAGSDTISFEAHTPADNTDFAGVTGVRVNLQQGTSIGQNLYRLSGFENVIGSAFDDDITGVRGRQGTVDGGLGENVCSGFAKASSCNEASPGDSRSPLVYINEGGILAVMGSQQSDRVEIGYDRRAGSYSVSAPGGEASGLCTGNGSGFNCPADANSLNGMVVYGNDGADDISLKSSIPRDVSTTINGGSGKSHIVGGPSKDFISTARYRSAGSVIEGRGNLDALYVNDDVIAKGGDGPDGIHVTDPCAGGKSIGGGQRDATIFAGARKGVKANIARGYAKWVNGRCRDPHRISRTIERLEGTRHNDHLILGKRMKAQQGKSSLLGRQGRNVLNSRNGVRDTVTTGPAARANKVIADRKDKVVYGWGLASF